MLKRARADGFTLVELLIGITIIGVLLALGAPSMATYLQNSKIGGAAANVAAGLQMARAEAIRRNGAVEFMLTNAALGASSVANTATADANGRNWIVRAASGTAFELVEARPATEGAGTNAAAVQLAASGAASVQFTPFGVPASGVRFSVAIENTAGGTCAPGGPMRCRRVVVGSGGRVQTCDPAAAAGDSRAC